MAEAPVTGEDVLGLWALADMAYLVAVNGHQAYLNSLVGNPAPVVKAYYERVTHPQPGDLVLEVSTWRRAPWNPGTLGHLVSIEQEPCWTEAEWAEQYEGYDEVPRPIPTERIYYIAPFLPTEDGELTVRWHNAEFIAMPCGPAVRWGGLPRFGRQP